jgi:ribonuclease HI
MLTGIPPILIELENLTQLYHITCRNELDGLYDAPKNYKEGPHPAEATEPKNKRNNMNYTTEIYTDGSKNQKGVGSGIAIFIDGNLTFKLRYKLEDKCSNNKAEQLAIAKALEKVRDLHQVQRNQRTLAIHTDSKITLEAIANPRNCQNFIELIREEIRNLENNSWIVHFTWVKAHNNNSGNELANQLAKEAACNGELEITYNKYPKSAVISGLKEVGLQKWQGEWDTLNKEALTKTFFPKVKDTLSKRLQMCLNISTVLTGHRKLRAYLHRFKITEDPMCPCEMKPQTTNQLIRECTLLSKQRQSLKNSIMKAGGNWPISNTELGNTYTNILQKFVNSINLETL